MASEQRQHMQGGTRGKRELIAPAQSVLRAAVMPGVELGVGHPSAALHSPQGQGLPGDVAGGPA